VKQGSLKPQAASCLLDISGREVMDLKPGTNVVRALSEGDVSPGRYDVRLPSGGLSAGIYFLRLDTPGFRSVKKAVVAR